MNPVSTAHGMRAPRQLAPFAIDISLVDTVEFIQAAYQLTPPVNPATTPLEMSVDIIAAYTNRKWNPIPYVNNELSAYDWWISVEWCHDRRVSLTIYKDEFGRLFIHPRWRHHGREQLKTLLEMFGLQNQLLED